MESTTTSVVRAVGTAVVISMIAEESLLNVLSNVASSINAVREGSLAKENDFGGVWSPFSFTPVTAMVQVVLICPCCNGWVI